MKSIKKSIKAIMPDKLVYLYSIIQSTPKFFRALKKGTKVKTPILHFYDDEKTVDKIVMEGMSLSRFGDGEFMWMTGERHPSYQDYSEEMANDLIKAFQNNNSKLLIGIPYGLFDSKRCNVYAKMYWKIIRAEFFSRLLKFVDYNKVYSNASITRPYIDYRDRKYSEKCFLNLKRIWDDKNIVIVEGQKTKLGMGNDLFSNAKTIRRIICPAENAYSKIEEIKQSIRKNVRQDEIILGALGPTASILAADMTNEGYQFIDIGHVDIEYMWYLKHEILRKPVEGKYVNESGLRECEETYESDQLYQMSIVDKISD